VRSAVSARPLRAPCVEMKYSRTVRPSLSEALTGISRMRPDGSDMSPRMPPSCLTCAIEPRAPEVAIMNTGLSGFWAACIAPVTSSPVFCQISIVLL